MHTLEDGGVSRTFPQVCLNCGRWLQQHSGDEVRCADCGHENNQYVEFYETCLVIERDLSDQRLVLEKIRSLQKYSLQRGWAPDILAVISAFALGILANASYDALKNWMRSRQAEYEVKYGHYDYEQLIDVLFDVVVDNLDAIECITFKDAEVRIRFRQGLGALKAQIEKHAGAMRNKS